jgi:hypothetical protein
MKTLILAIAALGLAGTIGTANADPVPPPDTSTQVEIWNNPNTTSDTITSNRQQALPGAAGLLPQVLATTSYVEPINYDLPSGAANVTIPGFFAASLSNPGQAAPVGCTGVTACATNTLSAGTGSAPPVTQFSAVTLFEFTFTAPAGGEMFSVTHDDGVSLFLAGTENNCAGFTSATCTSDLLPFAASGPVSSEFTSAPMNLGSLQTYDLWYAAANGPPEVLETMTTVVPAPPIGRGLPVILAVGGMLFGAKLWERSKRRSPLDTVGSHAAA